VEDAVKGSSPLRLVQNFYELVPQDDVGAVPVNTRGIYVLYKEVDPYFNVVYIGLSTGEGAGIRGRLRSHQRTKAGEWTHFSVFSVWPNIRDDEIKELEGLLRHIFRFDKDANRLAVAKAYYALRALGHQSKGWMEARSDIRRAWARLPHPASTAESRST
jgi:hypothetical protein